MDKFAFLDQNVAGSNLNRGAVFSQLSYLRIVEILPQVVHVFVPSIKNWVSHGSHSAIHITGTLQKNLLEKVFLKKLKKYRIPEQLGSTRTHRDRRCEYSLKFDPTYSMKLQARDPKD